MVDGALRPVSLVCLGEVATAIPSPRLRAGISSLRVKREISGIGSTLDARLEHGAL
jgi:hypothetical protein